MSIDHGDWHPETYYREGDLVWHAGLRYEAKAGNSGQLPTAKPGVLGRVWKRAPKPMKIGCGRGRGRRMLR